VPQTLNEEVASADSHTRLQAPVICQPLASPDFADHGHVSRKENLRSDGWSAAASAGSRPGPLPAMRRDYPDKLSWKRPTQWGKVPGPETTPNASLVDSQLLLIWMPAKREA
jgi:hypothetical protein